MALVGGGLVLTAYVLANWKTTRRFNEKAAKAILLLVGMVASGLGALMFLPG